MQANIFLAAGAAAAIGWASGAAAQNSAQGLSDPRQIVPSFDVQSLASIANETGYQTAVMADDNGAAYVKITAPEGVFYASPAACASGTCYGLDIYTFFGDDSSVSLETLNQFNQRSFTKALTIDHTVMLARYEIADYGIAKGNIAHNYTNFIALAQDFVDFLAGGVNQVSAKIESPQASDKDETPAVEASYTDEMAAGADLERRVKAMIAAGTAEPFKK